MLNVPLFFGYKLPGMSLSVSTEFLIGGTIIAGSIFCAPTVMIGLAIMMFIRRYYSWSLTNCIIGGVLSAFAVASIFLTTLMFTGQELMVAGAGFFMIMTLITVPSVFSGISFWLLAVYNNSDIMFVPERHEDFTVQPELEGGTVIMDNSLNIIVEDNLVQLIDKSDKPQVE